MMLISHFVVKHLDSFTHQNKVDFFLTLLFLDVFKVFHNISLIGFPGLSCLLHRYSVYML